MGAPSSGEAAAIARLIHDFCWSWAPSHLTGSESTLRNYRTALTLYLAFLESERGVTPATLTAAAFGTAVIEEWLVWLADERRNRPQTVNVRLTSLRAFCRYASRHDASFAGLEAQAAAVPKRAAPKTKVRSLSRDAVSAPTHQPGTTTRQGVRDTTIMVTLYATACRVGELLSLRVSDVHLDADSPYVLVRGKGDKQRVLFLPDKAVRHLRSYVLEFHGPEPDPGSYLFWSRNHAPGTHRLSDDAVTRMLQRHAAAAHESCPDVPPKLTAHRIRHARATHWHEDGMSIAQVSLMLGHEHVDTTMDYLDIVSSKQEEAMEAIADAPDEPKLWKADGQGGGGSLKSFCGLGPS